MPQFRVEVDGQTVWTGEADNASIYNFPPEHLARPADPAEGEPFPAAHHLFIDDELVGVQISLAEEQAQESAS